MTTAGNRNKNFELCHRITARFEGGLSDNKNDRGGITNYGCSMRFVAALDDDTLARAGIKRPVSAETIRKLSYDQAKILLKSEFWDRLKLDEMEPALACALYDGAVNSGCRQSVKWMQRAVNKYLGFRLTIDGILGPKTRQAVSNLDVFVIRNLVNHALCQRLDFLEGLVKKDASQGVFLAGWKNRVSMLQDYIYKEILF